MNFKQVISKQVRDRYANGSTKYLRPVFEANTRNCMTYFPSFRSINWGDLKEIFDATKTNKYNYEMTKKQRKVLKDIEKAAKKLIQKIDPKFPESNYPYRHAVLFAGQELAEFAAKNIHIARFFDFNGYYVSNNRVFQLK